MGAGNSGIDIAGHLIGVGANVKVAMRTPPNLSKGNLLGLPGQPFLVLVTDHLPDRYADFTFSIAQRLTFGDLSRFGIGQAKEGPGLPGLRRTRRAGPRRHHGPPPLGLIGTADWGVVAAPPAHPHLSSHHARVPDDFPRSIL